MGQKKENQTCPGEILTQDIQVTRWGGRPLRPSRSRRSLTCCSQTSPFETFIPKRLTLIVCGLQLLSCLPLWDIHRFLNEKKHLKRKYYKWLARDVCSGVTTQTYWRRSQCVPTCRPIYVALQLGTHRDTNCWRVDPITWNGISFVHFVRIILHCRGRRCVITFLGRFVWVLKCWILDI